jgi:hypothetical protein
VVGRNWEDFMAPVGDIFRFGFGIAGGLYKITLVLGISVTIAMKFPVLGLAMGGAYCMNEVHGVGKKALPYFWRSEE